MKKLIFKITGLGFFVAFAITQQSCIKDSLQTTYTYYEPVYKAKAAVLQSIKNGDAQPLKETGKLVKYGNFIFVNEINKGIHVIDNTNPASPKNISFINIPGNLDLAIRNNCLYVDIFSDLIAIDISNMANVTIKKVLPNIFFERLYGYQNFDSTKYIVDWERRTTTDKTIFNMNKDAMSSPVFLLSSAATTTGVGGSMARFTIVNDYLYTVGSNTLTSFNITTAFDPVKATNKSVGWNIETIYPFKDKLFIGGQIGMYVFSLSNPASPSQITNFVHACFNDPVIADDNYAYVTLRARTEAAVCWGGSASQGNQMDVINISNIMQPVLKKVYDMTEPKGLSKDGNYLFLSDGHAGLKVYDATNPLALNLIKAFPGINTFDVIAQAGNAIVVADNGLYQFDYSNISDIKLISTISMQK